jgi:NTP pyrophosphatase (non-canonical NTP hydrolase)
MQIPTGKYKIYHIPGIKVGCTTNIQKRVVETQGYRPGEYEILFETNDIAEASMAEKLLQEDLGYKVDRQLYKNLFKKSNKMNKCTSSEATTTFKISKNDINAEFLQDITIDNGYGKYVLDNEDKIEWVISNVHASQFGPKTCFVYNKVLANAKEFKEQPTRGTVGDNIFDEIRTWADNRGIYDKGDSKTQYIKLMEECGELAKALLTKDNPEVIDAIGDMVVVLTNLAKLEGYNIESCIQSAYDVINSRQGKMINGTFVKNS